MAGGAPRRRTDIPTLYVAETTPERAASADRPATDCASDGIRGLCKTIGSRQIPFLESRPPRISSGRRTGACKAECAEKSPRRLCTHRGEVVAPAFAGRALPMRIRRQSWLRRPTSGTLACSFFSPLLVIGFTSLEAKRWAAKVEWPRLYRCPHRPANYLQFILTRIRFCYSRWSRAPTATASKLSSSPAAMA
jgi:hypothetical protein